MHAGRQWPSGLERLRARTRPGQHVTQPEVITGQEEARLSFDGAVRGLPDGRPPCLVCDIGGGSTELVLGDDAGDRMAVTRMAATRVVLSGPEEGDGTAAWAGGFGAGGAFGDRSRVGPAVEDDQGAVVQGGAGPGARQVGPAPGPPRPLP